MTLLYSQSSNLLCTSTGFYYISQTDNMNSRRQSDLIAPGVVRSILPPWLQACPTTSENIFRLLKA